MVGREEMFRIGRQKKQPIAASPMQFAPMSTAVNIQPQQQSPMPSWEEAKRNWGFGEGAGSVGGAAASPEWSATVAGDPGLAGAGDGKGVGGIMGKMGL